MSTKPISFWWELSGNPLFQVKGSNKWFWRVYLTITWKTGWNWLFIFEKRYWKRRECKIT